MKVRNLVFAVLAGAFLVSCNSATETESVSQLSSEKVLVEEMEEVAETQLITLNQVPGEFTNGDLVLEAGTYRFEVLNSGVDHEVGLVVAPKKDEILEADHLTDAYVSETVKDGDSQLSKGEVVLEKGEYVFFCPLNPTPQYTITVE